MAHDGSRHARLERVRAFHRGALDLSDEQLDAALGLGNQSWRWNPKRDDALQKRHPGESIVNVATPYAVCRRLFASLALQDDDVVFDLGCGEGRVVLYGAVTTAARFVGLELVQERAEAARQTAAELQLERVSIVHTNALDHDLSNATVLYAFRPFSIVTEAAMLAQLHRLGRQRMLTVATHRLQPSLFDANVFERSLDGALVLYRSRGV